LNAEAAALTGKDDFTAQDVASSINNKTKERVGAIKEKGLTKIKQVRESMSQDREEWAREKFGDEMVEDMKGKINRFKRTSLRDKIHNAKNKATSVLKKSD